MRENGPTKGVVFVEITDACNYECRHCYLGKLPSLNEENTRLEEIRHAFDSLEGIAVNEIRFTGGEPMLAQSLAPMVEMCRTRGISYTIVSNGSGFRRENLEAIVSYPPRRIWLSLYAADEGRHDQMTASAGSFRRLNQTIALLRNRGIQYGIHLVVWPNLVGHLMECLDLAFGEMQAAEIKCIPIQAAGAALDSSARLVLNAEEMERVRRELQTWCGTNRNRLVRVAGVLGQPEGAITGCMFQERVFLTINHRGKISPCCLLMHDENWVFSGVSEALESARKVTGKGLPCASGKCGVCPLLLTDPSYEADLCSSSPFNS